MKLRTEFFNNKRLLVILSGISCVLIALVIFVVSLIGFGNIGAFLGGKPAVTEAPAGDPTPDNVSTATPPVTEAPVQTPDNIFSPGIVVTTPPVIETTPPTLTTPPVTDVPTETPTEGPTETPTPSDVPVTGVTIQQGLSHSMTVGTTLQLYASVTPFNATNQTISWNSSNPTIAMVNADGLVAALSVGEANITARAGGQFAQITIQVTAASVSVDRVIFDDDSKMLHVGESTVLTYDVSPSNATETNATWETSDGNVVTVVNGTITAVGAGEAVITVTVGGQKDTITVTVIAPIPEDPTPTPEDPTPTPEDPTPTPEDPGEPIGEPTDPNTDPATVG